MTRYAEGHKRDAKRRIVREASRLFRRKGSAGVGVAAIMDAAGLTHGGFYAHFSSKEQLLREAIVAAFEETRERHTAAAQAAPPDRRLATIVARYLTVEHRDDSADGCALAAFGSEIPRHPKSTRTVFARGVRGMAAMLADHAASDVSPERLLGIVCTLVGSLQLARAVDDPTLSEALLAAGRAASLHLAASADAD